MFFSFGLWNVLLLPFSLKVLGATEFQYGLQEGLTSVGFVVGSFFMARFSSLLPEPAWIVAVDDRAWASAASCTASRPRSASRSCSSRSPASSTRRRPCRAIGPAPAEHAARDARPGLLGVLRHARRRLPVRDGRRRPRRRLRHPAPDRRLASSLLFVSAGLRRWSLPGLASRPGARRRPGCAARRPRAGARGSGRVAPRRWPTSTGWPAGSARSAGCRPSSARPSSGTPRSATSPAGHAHRRARRRGHVRVLHPRRLDDGRHPGGRRLPRAVDDDRRRLLRRDRGADRQPPDGGRRGRRRHDPARGPGRGAASDDGRARRSSTSCFAR